MTLWLTTTGDENATLRTQVMVRAAKLAGARDGDPGCRGHTIVRYSSRID